jgi:hypothetical protein
MDVEETIFKCFQAVESFFLCVHVHGTTQIPLDRFLWKYVLGTSIKICGENSG